MLTLDQAQFIYDGETLDERFFCDKCDEEILGDYKEINDKVCCEYCFDKRE
jgi:formylmethanofuran dehydrogenase subunit E